MNKKIKNFPIEFYIILVPVILTIISLVFVDSDLSILNNSFIRDVVISSFKYNYIVICTVILLFIFLIIKAIGYIKNGSKDDLTKIIRSFLFINILVILVNFSFALIINRINNLANLDKVIIATNNLANIENKIFGMFPPGSIKAIVSGHVMESSLVNSYELLTFLIPIFFAFFILFDRKSFRKLMLAYTLAFFIAIPFWVNVPAISPSGMYRFNLLKQPIPEYVEESYIKHQLSPYMVDKIALIEIPYVDVTFRSMAISSFPSMHAAWAIILAVLSIMIYWPIGVVVSIWALLNMIGAIYVEQHFAVDILFGGIIGIISLWLSIKIISMERLYYEEKYSFFFFIDEINDKCRHIFMELWKKVHSFLV